MLPRNINRNIFPYLVNYIVIDLMCTYFEQMLWLYYRILILNLRLQTASAQHRPQESLSPQTTTIQRHHQLNQPTGLSSLDFLSPYSQIPRPRQEIKRIKQNPTRLSKRQYLAEVFKRSAINKLITAAKTVKEQHPFSNKMAYHNSVASDVNKWRL